MKSKTDNLGAGILIGIVVAVIFIALLLMGCTTTRVVEVPVTHQEHHWHTDSVHEVDSVIKEQMTTVMMLDSAAMAKYGIQLKSAERAWLVRTAELERQLKQLTQTTQTADTVRDTVTVVVKAESTEAKLTWWDKIRIHMGNIFLFMLAAAAAVICLLKIIKK